MKIYTRTGDEGQTALFAGGRVSKGHARLYAYGSVDELNTIIGLALAAGIDDALRTVLERVQSELFIVGADLATPLAAQSKSMVRITPDLVAQLEQEIDVWDETLPALKNFILPGGSLTGGFLHQARTVCRRAERWAVMVQESETINAEVLRYLNRLSDWLFVLARVTNYRAGHPEMTWLPPVG